MSLDEREYMKDQNRARSGGRNQLIWRERHGRMEYDEGDLLAGAYPQRTRVFGDRAQPGRRKNNLVWAALLAVGVVAYTLIAQPFGQLLDFSGMPASGEFRVHSNYAKKPTAKLVFTAGNDPVALHLLDSSDSVIFVGFVRALETAELTIPAGNWHTVATLGARDSLAEIPAMRTGTPMGVLRIKAGETISIKPNKTKGPNEEGIER